MRPDNRLRTESVDGVLVLRLEGEFDMADAPVLRVEMRHAARKVRCLVVDLTCVTYMDSTTIGVLMSSARKLHDKGGELELVCPEGMVRRLLNTVGVVEVLPVFDTTADALPRARAECERR